LRRDAAEAYTALRQEHEVAIAARLDAARRFARAEDDNAREALRVADGGVQQIRSRARELVRQTTGDATFDDVNYIIPGFILEHIPVGLVGLLILAILLAATDTIAGELNSLSTATVIDFYRRWVRPEGTDAHYLAVSRIATGVWGLFACMVAVWAAELGSLIEVVNRIGSFFYGSVLGVFILAIAFPRATGTGAFVGLIAGMSAVAWFASFTPVAFLWHNVIGAVAVVVVGLAISLVTRR
jgi:Na+/proline symporter